jgi:ssDNA-binding replication factor A large subunit
MIESNKKLDKSPDHPSNLKLPSIPGQSRIHGQPVWSSAEERRQLIGAEEQKVVDLQGQSFVRSLDLLILRKYPRRVVASARYSGMVCSAVGRDDTGIVGIVLWGEHVNMVKSGDVVRINNGWCRAQNGELVVSTGRSGRLTFVES